MMIIGGLLKFSMLDYRDGLCAIVFTSGCNFRCPWCHNPELVVPTDNGGALPVEDFMSWLETRVGKLDAVVITGGEPTIHADLPDFIRSIRDMGFLVKLDTNGSNPDMLETLLTMGLLDYVAMDIKAPFEKYSRVVGVPVDPESIKRSIGLIERSGIQHEFRTTCVGEFLLPEDIVTIREEMGPAMRYFLQRFNDDKVLDEDLKHTPTFSDNAFAELTPELVNHYQEFAIR